MPWVAKSMGLYREQECVDDPADRGDDPGDEYHEPSRRRHLRPPRTCAIEQECQCPHQREHAHALKHGADQVKRKALVDQDQLDGQLRDLRLRSDDLYGRRGRPVQRRDAGHDRLPRPHPCFVGELVLGRHGARKCTVRRVQPAPPAVACWIAWRSVPSSEPALGERRFELRRCVSCGSAVTVGDPPAESHETGAYRAGDPRLYGLARPVLEAFDRQRLGPGGRARRPGARLLDVGAGRGRFVVAARDAGYDAFGIEPSAARGRRPPPRSGLPVRRRQLRDGADRAGSVDVVTRLARARASRRSWRRRCRPCTRG